MRFLHRNVIVGLGGITLLAVLLAIGLATTRSVISKRTASGYEKHFDQIPRVVLWAWERPTDLTFIDPRQTAVAFLARTIHLQGNEVVTRPRLQPLKLPKGVTLVAVARVESDVTKKPELLNEQVSKLAAAITEIASLPNIANIQIDFDATKTERRFYREVIIE